MSNPSYAVRPMAPTDIPGVVALQRACFPPPFPEDQLWRPDHLAAHLDRFPVGQFVAVDADGLVIGSASAARVPAERWHAHLGWEATLGGWGFEGHDSDGDTLYGADVSVHPSRRGQGIARALYGARFDLVRRLGLCRYGTACRLPGAAAWRSAHPGAGPRAYAALVAAGDLTDPTMTPLLRLGCRWIGVIDGYMEDAESLDAAALLEWTP